MHQNARQERKNISEALLYVERSARPPEGFLDACRRLLKRVRDPGWYFTTLTTIKRCFEFKIRGRVLCPRYLRR